MKFKLLFALALVILLSGCGAVNEESEKTNIPQVVTPTKSLADQISDAKTSACRAWSQDVKAGVDVGDGDMVLMSLRAASLFQELADLDASFEYAAKSAFVLTTFRSRPVAESMKPLLALSAADMMRVCGSG